LIFITALKNVHSKKNLLYIYNNFLFKIKPVGVERETYAGPVIDLTKQNLENGMGKLAMSPPNANGNFHNRAPTRGGGRNMQDSSFSFSGEQWDDKYQRSSTKVCAPPGGKSSGIF
jgi:hypothetical protein